MAQPIVGRINAVREKCAEGVRGVNVGVVRLVLFSFLVFFLAAEWAARVLRTVFTKFSRLVDCRFERSFPRVILSEFFWSLGNVLTPPGFSFGLRVIFS